MVGSEALAESLTKQPFIDSALSYAINRNPALADFDLEKVIGLLRRAALEMAAFEKLATTNPLHIPETADEAKKIRAFWDLSAVGTYLKEFQDDRWKGTTWAGWTDRRRLNYSGALMRRLTEKITGRSYKVPLGSRLTPDQANQLKADIEKFGPFLIYGSTAEQNEDLELTLDEQGVVIPKTKVLVIDFPDKQVGVNTIDQMQNFSLPSTLQIEEGDILAVVAHTPHLVRALHMAHRFKPFPEGLIIQPHPLPIPLSAGTEYPAQEISGLLYYTFITGDSSEQPYPFQI